MDTIKLNGVTHAYPYQNEQLPAFLRECCRAMELTVPIEQIHSKEFIERKVLESIKKNHEKSVVLSWINHPEQMGR